MFPQMLNYMTKKLFEKTYDSYLLPSKLFYVHPRYKQRKFHIDTIVIGHQHIHYRVVRRMFQERGGLQMCAM